MNRESSRFLSGLVAVSDRNKIFYTIEKSCGYTDNDKAIRIILRDPLSKFKYLDLVFAEPHIVDIQNETSPVTGKTFKVYRLREEHKFSFNSGFKDSFALF